MAILSAMITTGNVSSCAVGCRRRSHCKVKAAATTASSCARSASCRTDYYKVLSLEHRADVGVEEVRRAYRRLVLQYHPDVCPPSRRAESTELFVELRRAYETLSSPALRSQYDAQLKTGGAAARPEDGFATDVWEAQLCVLRERSERRHKAAATGSRHGRPI